MEKIDIDLKLLEVKQRNLSKTFEELHSLSSFKGRDLESQFATAQSLLQTQLEQLMECENEILSKESQLEAVLVDLEEKKLDVESLQSLIEKKCEELEVKEAEYNAIQISITEKEAEFDHIQKSISEAAKKLDLLEKSIEQKSKEAESKSKELDSVKGMLKNFDSEIELKDSQLGMLQKSFEDCSKEFELKTEHLKECRASIDDCNKEIKKNEKQLNSIQNSIAVCSKDLELKEKRLELVQKLKEQNLESLRKSIKQYAHEFETKEKKLESWIKELELKEELLESRFEELDLMYKKVNDCLIEAKAGEKTLALLQGLVEKRSSELEMKESQFERSVDEFRSAQKEFELIRKSTEVGLKETKIKQLKLSYQSSMTEAKKDLYEVRSHANMNGQAAPAFPLTICIVDKGPGVAESIQKLIRRGEIIHAIRHIFELKLTDKFSPVPLLIEYLEDAENYTTLFCGERNSFEAKMKVVDKEVSVLRATSECITDCNLKSEFPSDKISKRIGILENKARALALESEQLKKRRISSFAPLDQSSQQGNAKSPRTTKRDNVLTNHVGGRVKMSFCCASQADGGFLSVVARNNNGMVLAIWCRKISQSDSLVGEVLAARGALTLASSSGWEDITLEGNSEEVISYLQQSQEPILTLSSMVTELVGLLGSFKSAVPIYITREANIMAHNVSQWAARNDVQDGPSWMSVPSCLFYIFS